MPSILNVLLVALTACVLLPLWLARQRSAVLLGLLALGAVAWAAFTQPPAVQERNDQRPLVEPHGSYIGSASCRSCHPAEHASWHGSFHRTMTQLATRSTLVPQFDRLELDWFGETVVLEWRGERLWTQFRRRGGRPADVDRPIEQLTGSHHLQVLWYSTGVERELAPVPMGFHLEQRVWLPLTTVFVLPPEFRDPPDPGVWNKTCDMCHATGTLPRLDVGRTDTQVAELGIACEACHGPGGPHAAANRDPLARYQHRTAGGDDTIVNPAKLSAPRSGSACGQCHSVSILRQQHFDAWREQGSPFVPGGELQATHLVIGPEDRDAVELRRELQKNPHFFRSSFWSDGQVRLSGREWNGVRRSPCYTRGQGERQLDCTSCHAMHTAGGAVSPEWRRSQMRPDMASGDAGFGNAACTQCHEALAAPDALRAHTHHDPDSVGSRCYDCHMPHTSVGLMKTSRSHTIDSPDVKTELATGRPNACNLCHLDRTLQWTAERLAAGWGVAMPELDEEQRSVAAGVRWLLTGDAGLRLIAAANFGQPAAQAAAGRDWMAPFLARLLDDPYYVVRFRAAATLRGLGYDEALAGFVHTAEAPAAQRFVDTAMAAWQARGPVPPRPALLLDAEGLQRPRFAALYARRDNRPIYLAE
ncbi:MAG: multiheme c-type cytochrome [Planctomycetota bacterium]